MQNKNVKGLTQAEAQQRQKQYGYNEFSTSKNDSIFENIKKILLDPMGLMLLGLAFLYLFLGNKSDSIILFIAYIPITAVDVILEVRAQKALEALKESVQRHANVIREGVIQLILVRDLVPGDIVVFEEGQTLPADGRIIDAHNLFVNESSLTGESVPVEKNVDNEFYCGTTVLQGTALGEIATIGSSTKFGKIATLLDETQDIETPFQKKVNALVKKIIYFSAILSVLLFFVSYLRDSNISHSLIVALTFGMASIPEEFPLVFTLYLSIGAWRLSRHGVLVKSLPSVEALGSVDVICTDKTGTLTEGQFQLEKFVPLVEKYTEEEIWRVALMACEIKAVDSMELAITTKAKNYLSQLHDWNLKWDYSFDPIGKHMSHVWVNEKSNAFCVAMKGSVEGVSFHCNLSVEEKNEITKLLEEYAGQGKRILALATKSTIATGNREADEKDLTFLGLLIFNDPVRYSAIEAIKKCQASQIKVKMITGDHPLTAHAVADEVGIIHTHKDFYTGDILSKLSEKELTEAYLSGTIFSRVLPEQKYAMIKTLKEHNHIVAMTGDGINDAPALKLADIGISMGEHATDVARSAAQMILVKNDFKGIVEALFEGRKIFANLQKSFSYLIAFHIPVILLTLLPNFFGEAELLLPIHIVLLELVVHPISAFTFENMQVEVNRPNSKSLIAKNKLITSIYNGIAISLTALIIFLLNKDNSPEYARTLALISVLFGNISFVLIECLPKVNIRFFMTSIGLTLLTLSLIYLDIFNQYFHLAKLDMKTFLTIFMLSFAVTIPSYIFKYIQIKKYKALEIY